MRFSLGYEMMNRSNSITTKQSNLSSKSNLLINRIDDLVFKLYDLTYEEVKVIAPDFWLSEEEYENTKLED